MVEIILQSLQELFEDVEEIAQEELENNKLKNTFKEIISKEERLGSLFKTFTCSKNKDVEDFLHNKAIKFELENKSRTYLIFSLTGEIMGYFSIAIKPVILDKRKHSYQRHREEMRVHRISKDDKRHDVITTFLIGQIGRDDRFKSSSINLVEILSLVFEKINEVIRLIGGHILLIEVDNNPKLVSLYEDVGFVLLKTGSENEHTQLMKFSYR